MRDQVLTLTRITLRAEHLSDHFRPMLSETECRILDYQPLQIAKLEQQRGLLEYIKVL